VSVMDEVFDQSTDPLILHDVMTHKIFVGLVPSATACKLYNTSVKTTWSRCERLEDFALVTMRPPSEMYAVVFVV
jgi:hypothetical protein